MLTVLRADVLAHSNGTLRLQTRRLRPFYKPIYSGRLTKNSITRLAFNSPNRLLSARHSKKFTSKYLNNLVEQGHRRVKQRIYPMLGFKKLANAAVTITGIELVLKIGKGQFTTAKLTDRVGERVPHVREAVLPTQSDS